MEHLKQMRKDITKVIDDIKYHSDSLTPLERLPIIQLNVLLAKIHKLNDKVSVLLHLVEEASAEQKEITSDTSIEGDFSNGEESKPMQAENPQAAENKESVDISEKLKRMLTHDLNQAIGINEKFLYAHELFDADMDAFKKSIEELNKLEELSDAITYLQELQSTYSWDLNSEQVKSFQLLVEAKFK